ncbi:MAG: hypothetical protein AB7Q29_06665 [Vicinamibacterales bacterium]
MRLKVESVLSGLTSFTALAYVLGWLKSYYFYRTLGVGLDVAGLSTQDYLFESWFVLENVAFFALLWWVVLAAPTWWAWTLGIAYSLLPIAAQYAFAQPSWLVSALLIASRHTLLKAVPFVFLAVRYFSGSRATRTALRTVSWPHGQGALALCLTIAVAWAISTAKHFGSYDALQHLQAPEQYMSFVVVQPTADLAGWDSARSLYLLRKSETNYVLLDLSRLAVTHQIGVVIVPVGSVRFIEGAVRRQIQLGNQWF